MMRAVMRTKSISRFEAGVIITQRTEQAQRGTVLSLSEFADWLLRENYIATPIRRQTLWRILTKRYYPDLETFEGEPIDYSKIPENIRGVPKESLVEHNIRDLRGGFHELRHEVHETASELRERLAQLNARIDERDPLISAQNTRIVALGARIVALGARLAALENRIMAQSGVNAAPATVIDAAEADATLARRTKA
jgi:hypothetical protein